MLTSSFENFAAPVLTWEKVVLLFSRLHPLSEAYIISPRIKRNTTSHSPPLFFLSFSSHILYRIITHVCTSIASAELFVTKISSFSPSNRFSAAVCLACIQKKVALRLFPISSTGRGRRLEEKKKSEGDDWWMGFPLAWHLLPSRLCLCACLCVLSACDLI